MNVHWIGCKSYEGSVTAYERNFKIGNLRFDLSGHSIATREIEVEWRLMDRIDLFFFLSFFLHLRCDRFSLLKRTYWLLRFSFNWNCLRQWCNWVSDRAEIASGWKEERKNRWKKVGTNLFHLVLLASFATTRLTLMFVKFLRTENDFQILCSMLVILKSTGKNEGKNDWSILNT